MEQLQPEDKVICINDGGFKKIKNGFEYTIVSVSSDGEMCSIDGVLSSENGFYTYRFKKIKPLSTEVLIHLIKEVNNVIQSL
jgi:hypothetical protein